jgi:hypothetical protein
MSNVIINVTDQVEQVVVKVNENPTPSSSDTEVFQMGSKSGTWNVELPETDKNNIVLVYDLEAGEHIISWDFPSLQNAPVGARVTLLLRNTTFAKVSVYFVFANLYKEIRLADHVVCEFILSESSSGNRNLLTIEKGGKRTLTSNATNSTVNYTDITELTARLNGGQRYKLKWVICFRTVNSSHSVKISLFPNPGSTNESFFTARQEVSSGDETTHVSYYDKYDVNTNPTTSRFQSPSNKQNLCVIEAVAWTTQNWTITPRFRSTNAGSLVTIIREKSYVEWERMD